MAEQLTHGYWESSGENWRTFDVRAGGTLSYDVSALSPRAQFIARTALQAWSDVTDIRFRDVGIQKIINEVGDAGGGTGTSAQLGVNQIFAGKLGNTTDKDWVKVRLQAGEQYNIDLVADGSATQLSDPFLELRSSTGALIASNDDGGDVQNAHLSFTPDTTGTYFLVAKSYNNSVSGTYRLSLQSNAADAQLVFGDDGDGAFSTSEISGNTILSSFINVAANWDQDKISINSYWFQTYVHEIGHALGLGHAGNYNGDAVWGLDQLYSNDSWQASVMSYFSQDQNPNINSDFAFLATVMPADILAIQSLYGSDVSTRAGNTIYGANTNLTGYLGQLFKMAAGEITAQDRVYTGNPVALTIFDTGGNDTIDVSNGTMWQLVNLAPGAASSIGGMRGNLVIAPNTFIENVNGGQGRDKIIGNVKGNWLRGNNGDDKILGYGGSDTLSGGAGNDTINGGAGSADWAVFTTARHSATVNLTLTGGQNTGFGIDILLGIENLRGSKVSDRLTGNDARNVLAGLAGNDKLTAGRGNDRLDGHSGNDSLYGNQGADRILGGAGNDFLDGGIGDDTVTGGTGQDRFVFTGGRDVITDFSNNTDTLLLSRAIWGGGSRSVSRVLQDAERVGNDIVFSFGAAHSLTLQNVDHGIAALADDILIF